MDANTDELNYMLQHNTVVVFVTRGDKVLSRPQQTYATDHEAGIAYGVASATQAHRHTRRHAVLFVGQGVYKDDTITGVPIGVDNVILLVSLLDYVYADNGEWIQLEDAGVDYLDDSDFGGFPGEFLSPDDGVEVPG